MTTGPRLTGRSSDAPCLSLSLRFYVVLPAEVETSLPFAINAPSIQDPARAGISPPEISPTNRWLLKRAGALAAVQRVPPLVSAPSVCRQAPSPLHRADEEGATRVTDAGLRGGTSAG